MNCILEETKGLKSYAIKVIMEIKKSNHGSKILLFQLGIISPRF
jgi:hypothetical protein